MIGRMLIMKKMIIQKRVKASLIAILLLIMLSGLCSCSRDKQLTENDFRAVKAGMSTDRVKEILGNPQKIIEDEKFVEMLMDEDSNSSTDRWSSENPDIFDEFYGKKKKYYYDILDRMKGITCYEYGYKYDEKSSEIEKWHIYFYEDEVIWMTFP